METASGGAALEAGEGEEMDAANKGEVPAIAAAIAVA